MPRCLDVADPEHRRTQRRPARVALTVVKGASLGALLSIVVVGGIRIETPDADPSAQTASEAYERVVQRAVAAHNCSFEGYGDSAIPASALIRTTAGEVRQVSFEVGWDIYNGKRPGTLIAVCLDDNNSSGIVQVHD
jgi:hypothetical protein